MYITLTYSGRDILARKRTMKGHLQHVNEFQEIRVPCNCGMFMQPKVQRCKCVNCSVLITHFTKLSNLVRL